MTPTQRSVAMPALGRRSFLAGLSAGAAAVAGSGLLAGCGSNAGTKGDAGQGTTDTSTQDKTLAFANWPLYIDVKRVDGEKTYPTLQEFQAQTGITVDYTEPINDNDEYFAKIRPVLASGKDIGADIIVVTDYMSAKLKSLGYLAKLDTGNLTQVQANIEPTLAHPGFDPNREFSVPWQSGITGIAYDSTQVDSPPTSYADLFDPKYARKVTLFRGMRESLPAMLMAQGAAIDSFTDADVDNALAKLQEVVDSGQVRQFTGNDYIKELAAGNLALCLAYSGDVLQLQFDNPNIKFVVPEEGGELWSDNMSVPAYSPHRANAEKLMDFYYDPKVAAELVAWVNYICPVAGAQDEMRKLDPELAESELIFPTEQMMSRLHIMRDITEAEEQQYTLAFQQTIGLA